MMTAKGTLDDGTLRAGAEALDSARQRRRISFPLGLVFPRHDVSLRSCRYGMCGLSCVRPRVSITSMAVVGDCTGGGNSASLPGSLFFGCGCRAFVGCGSLFFGAPVHDHGVRCNA